MSRYDTEEDRQQDEEWEEYEEEVEAAPALPPPRTRRPPAPRFTAIEDLGDDEANDEADEETEEPVEAPVAAASASSAAPPPVRRAVRPQATPPQRRDPTRSKRRQPAADEAITVRPAASAAPARRSLSRGAMLRLGVIGLLALVVVGGAALAGLGVFNPPVTYAPTPTAGVGVTGKANYEPPADKIVARVNDVPIMYDDWQRRIGIDKTNMLADPFSAMMLNNFEGITGTRALDVLYYDSLDKLINFEIIQQQAVKENMLPTADEQKQMLDQAHAHDTTPDKPFDQFLAEHKLSQEQYDHNVIASVIYAAMANKHMPAAAAAQNDDERVSKFIEWMCGLRKDYKVEIYVTFAVYNQACTSGLPSDVPIVGEPTPAPEAIPTGPAPTLPPGTTPGTTPVNTPSSPNQAPPAVPTGSAAPVGTPNQ